MSIYYFCKEFHLSEQKDAKLIAIIKDALIESSADD